MNKAIQKLPIKARVITREEIDLTWHASTSWPRWT